MSRSLSKMRFEQIVTSRNRCHYHRVPGLAVNTIHLQEHREVVVLKVCTALPNLAFDNEILFRASRNFLVNVEVLDNSVVVDNLEMAFREYYCHEVLYSSSPVWLELLGVVPLLKCSCCVHGDHRP